MEVVDFDMKYYQYIYGVLKSTGMKDNDMAVLRLDTKVLIDEDKPVGFFTGEKINEYFNLHHFYIEPEKRGFEAIWKLVPYMIKYMKNLGCKFLCMHAIVGTETDDFIKSYFRKNKIEMLNSPVIDVEFYKVEV